MKRILLSASTLILASSLALAYEDDQPDSELVIADLGEMLSGIDFVPYKSELDDVLPQGASDLIAIASDSAQTPGVRIRAYRALEFYPGENTRAALQSAVDEHVQVPSSSTQFGLSTLYLRVALHSLAVLGAPEAAPIIHVLLTHESQDVRAEAARAAMVVGDSALVPALRERLHGSSPEKVPHVIWSVTEALRVLE